MCRVKFDRSYHANFLRNDNKIVFAETENASIISFDDLLKLWKDLCLLSYHM